MPLPEDNLLAFSYLIPVERIAELSPTVDKLIRSDAWDHGFERRLHTWFDDPDEDPVKITIVPPDSGTDRTLQFLLQRAELRYQDGRSSRPGPAAPWITSSTRPDGIWRTRTGCSAPGTVRARWCCASLNDPSRSSSTAWTRSPPPGR
ncbi:hypothetical protein [Streptomyces flaveus]|nr:hypothetical protein [Streptomyces flaveus]